MVRTGYPTKYPKDCSSSRDFYEINAYIILLMSHITVIVRNSSGKLIDGASITINKDALYATTFAEGETDSDGEFHASADFSSQISIIVNGSTKYKGTYKPTVVVTV